VEQITVTVERPTAYSPAAKWLHWIMAAAVLFAIPVSITMIRLKQGPLQDALFDLHRSTGTLILALAIVRVIVRLVKGAPPPHPALAPWQRVASLAAHRALYVLILVVPMLGWLATSAYGAPIIVYGLFELPPLLAKNEKLSDWLFLAHQTLALTMAAILAVHIGAALWHGFVRRDGVLARMLPTGGRP
jgi:cytochrome b561